MRISYLIVPILFLLLTLIFFQKVILNTDKIIYPAPDTVNMLSSWRFLFHEIYHSYGELPMWNNYETSGTPFFGNILSAMFYPFNLLFLIFPTDLVFGYKFVIDVFLAGFFMYLLARQLKLDRYSSFFSSVVYMFSGIFIGRIQIGHEPAIDIIALTPLLFMLFLKTLENRSIKYGILTGVVFGFQILAGYLQFAIYVGYLLLGYFLYDLIVSRKFDRKSLFPKGLLISIVFVTAFLISVVQLLPSFELSGHAIQAGETIKYNLLVDEASSYSLTPEYTVSFIMPDFFGSRTDGTYWASDQFEESTAYFGILPLLLLSLPIIFERNRYTIFFVLVAVVALMFSYGQYNPLFPILHKIILVLDTVRNPARFLTLFVFATAILSGFGFRILTNFLRKGDKEKTCLGVKILLAFSLITAVVLGWYLLNKAGIVNFVENGVREVIISKLNTPSPDRIGNYVLDFYSNNANIIAQKLYNHIAVDIGKLLFVFLGASALLVLAVKSKVKLEYILLGLIAIALADLWMFGIKYIDVAPLEKVYPRNEVTDFIVEDYQNDRFRVLGMNRTMEPRFATRNGIETLDGVLPPTLRIYAEYLTAVNDKKFTGDLAEPVVRTIENPKMLDLLNVKYILTTEPFTNEELNKSYTLVFSKKLTKLDVRKDLEFNQTVYVYRNDNYLPRVLVVENFKVAPDEDNALEELKKEDFDPKKYIILEKSPRVTVENTNGYSESEVEITDYSPNKITLSVIMKNPGFVFLSEVWYPDWKAYVQECSDDSCLTEKKETEIFKTNYLFRSIYLDDGQYKVEFLYSNLNNLFNKLKYFRLSN